MASFEFTFTFAIAMPPPKKEPKDKKSKPQKDTKEIESQEVEQTTFQIDSKPFEYIHVNYTIVPKILEYEFDIAVWGSVAKVYTSGICKALKTFVSNEGKVAWISFSICHHKALTDSDLAIIYENDVVFNIECGVKKVGQRAKSDKPKQFQIVQVNDSLEEQPENVLFPQLEEVGTVPQPSRAPIAPESLLNTKVEKSVLCGYPSAGHVKKVERYIEQYSGEKLETLLQRKDVHKEKVAKPSDKKGKKDKGKKDRNISLHGELFFTDMKDFSSQLECLTPTIPYASVISSVVDLLTEEQKIKMNPTIVRIEKLVCLPTKGLLANKFKGIFFKIHLYGDVEIITEERPLAHEMIIRDTHAVIMHPLRQKAFLQQLQTGLFRIEIYGTRDETHCGHPIAFGEDGNTPYSWSFRRCSASFSHEVKYAKDWGKTTLLAVAHFDPHVFLHDHINIEDWVKVEPLPYGKHLLSEGDLRRCCLKLAIRQTRSLKEPLMMEIGKGNHFNRMCIISKDEYQASLVLKFIDEINEGLVPRKTKVLGNPLHGDSLSSPGNRKPTMDTLYNNIFLKALGEDPLAKITKNPAESLLSGFIFTDQDRIIIFLEGPANGKIQNLIHELNEQPIYDDMLIHYHSQLIFEERKYSKYLTHGGFKLFIIDEPLHNKVSRNGILMNGSLQEDVRRTLLNLYRLTSVKDIVQASKENLFPTPESFANFDIQFGVPLLIDAALDLLVPKRLHRKILDAPQISAYHKESSQEQLEGSESSEDEDEEWELEANSYNSILKPAGSWAF